MMTGVEIAFHHERLIDPQDLCELYSSVDWWPLRTPHDIGQVLQGALAVGAWEGDHLVGFARVVSDQRFHAYIEDVVVQPDHQRRGVGRLLLMKLLAGLQEIETVTLFCHQSLIPFYEEHGFRAFPSQALMHRQRILPPEGEGSS
jgi:GNAT superfamily N-acetyltransferase